MLLDNLKTLLLLPAAIRGIVAASTAASSSTACNNSPSLCNIAYNDISYLGAHDSPFVRDAATSYSISGNQYYNSTVQLSAGVRLLTAQVQRATNNALHVCHSSCDLLDAGTLSSWLSEVRTWIDANPNDVVTILIVNGAAATVTELERQYQKAGIDSTLAYTPNSNHAAQQAWPTLQTLIDSGTRLVNFVDYITPDPAVPWIMEEFRYIFENNYDVSTLDGFSCAANRPATAVNNLSKALANGVMPLMNHFVYTDAGLGIQSPNAANASYTNSRASLGSAATTCTQEYGRAPAFILVDFFNVGPAIATVDRLNNVTNPVGRKRVSTASMTQDSAATKATRKWTLGFCCLAVLLVCGVS